MTLKNQKKALRKEVKKCREELSEKYCEEADHSIQKHVMQLPEYQSAQTIFCFVGTEEEIDTRPVIQDALMKKKRVCVPRCLSPGVMGVYLIDSLEDLVAGHYGILEPGEDAVMTHAQELDVAIVPCVSCSRDGRRLGHGGGYYDRYLEQCHVTKVVVCRDKLMREDIPMNEHDQVMDIVISETGALRT